jgi:hypothetical protein
MVVGFCHKRPPVLNLAQVFDGAGDPACQEMGGGYWRVATAGLVVEKPVQ